MAETDNPTPASARPGFNEILGSLLILMGLLLSLAVISYDNQAAMGLQPGTVQNWTGTVGHYGAMLLFILFGKASYVLGPLMVYMGLRGLVQSRSEDYVPGMLGSLTMVTALSLFFHFYTPLTYSDVQGTDPISGGGALGYRVGEMLKFLFGTYGAFLVALGILVPGFLYTFRLPFPEFLNLTRNRLGRMREGGRTGVHRLLYVLFPPPPQKVEEPTEEKEEVLTTGQAGMSWHEYQGLEKGNHGPLSYDDYTNQDESMKQPLWEKKEQSSRKPWIEKKVMEESEPLRPRSWTPERISRSHAGMDPRQESLLEMEHRHSNRAISLEDDSDGLEPMEGEEEALSRPLPDNPSIPGYFDPSGKSYHFTRKRPAPFRKDDDGYLGVLNLESSLRNPSARQSYFSA
ncbi:MAG: DNA translocase FtsK 4TM domain-containing protein, partial [Leptospiraceae bacterium]|nr:DNA translocase FtsK 4TM domain-containing protein [Leptospiraceae bacterium]